MSLEDYPVDYEYISVEPEPAELSQSDEVRYDGSHTYGRSDNAMSGTEHDIVIDKRDVYDRDERGGTRTGFDASEATGYYAETVYREGKKMKRASWLRTLQDGYRDRRRRQDNSEAERDSYIEIFTSNLELGESQVQRVQHIIESIDLSEMGPYPKEMVILGAISIVANENDRWIRDEKMFHELVTSVDGSMNGIKNTRQLLKQKSDFL